MLAAAAFALPSGADEMDPVANPDACVVAGNARFTVLTDRLVRMEWSENGVFEDNATLAVINRNLPVPEFRVTRDGDAVRIRTSALTLDYSGEGRFDESNLSVSFRMNGRRVEWHPGMSSEGNLMGTARTLDGCMGPDKINNNDPMETGVLSRDGWAIVDESERHLFVEDGCAALFAFAAIGRRSVYAAARGRGRRLFLCLLLGVLPVPVRRLCGALFEPTFEQRIQLTFARKLALK